MTVLGVTNLFDCISPFHGKDIPGLKAKGQNNKRHHSKEEIRLYFQITYPICKIT